MNLILLHSPNNYEVLLRIYLLCMAMQPKEIVILFYRRAHHYWTVFFLGVCFVPYAMSCLLSSTQTLCLKSLFLKTTRQTLWTQLQHRPQSSIWNCTFCKAKKLLGTKWCNCTVSASCETLDSPLRTTLVCRLPPLFAWFVSSSACSSCVSGASWECPDSVASLWTAEVLPLSNSRSASSWRPRAGRSMTAPDRAAAGKDTLTPDEWRSCCSCGFYILHCDAPWMHIAWSNKQETLMRCEWEKIFIGWFFFLP